LPVFLYTIIRKDGGVYECKAENSFGNDAIMHTLVVQAPPPPPSISLAGTTGTTITVRLKSPTDSSPLHGMTLHYKQDFGDFETTQISPTVSEYTLEGNSRVILFKMCLLETKAAREPILLIPVNNVAPKITLTGWCGSTYMLCNGEV